MRIRNTVAAVLRAWLAPREGPSVIEYSLLLSLIVLVAVTFVTAAHGHASALATLGPAVISR